MPSRSELRQSTSIVAFAVPSPSATGASCTSTVSLGGGGGSFDSSEGITSSGGGGCSYGKGALTSLLSGYCSERNSKVHVYQDISHSEFEYSLAAAVRTVIVSKIRASRFAIGVDKIPELQEGSLLAIVLVCYG